MAAAIQAKADMRIVAFTTEASPVQRILSHIGEPAEPPPKHCPHARPTRLGAEAEALQLADPIAQPEPDLQFDQTPSW